MSSPSTQQEDPPPPPPLELSEGHELAYSRLTLPSYLYSQPSPSSSPGGDSDGLIEDLVALEMGPRRDVRMPLQVGEDGMLDVDDELFRSCLKEQLGVVASSDFSSYSCMGILKVREELIAQKLLEFRRGRCPPEQDEVEEEDPPPLEATPSTNDEYTCSICICVFIHPVSLPCGHVCCKECLEVLMRQHYRQRVCPMCRESIPSDHPMTINTEIQTKVEKIFAVDKEYCDRKEEVADLIAKKEGKTIYRFLQSVKGDQSLAVASDRLPDRFVQAAKEVYDKDNVALRGLLKSVFRDPVVGSCGEVNEEMFRRFNCFYKGVEVNDFDSVLAGCSQTLQHEGEGSGGGVIQSTPFHRASSFLSYPHGRFELCRKEFFARLFASLGHEADKTFVDLCDSLLCNFMHQTVTTVATTVKQQQHDCGRQDIQCNQRCVSDFGAGSRVIQKDDVLSHLREHASQPSSSSRISRGLVLYGEGGRGGIRLVLSPVMLELNSSLNNHTDLNKKDYYLSSTAVSTMHDMLVDLIDSILHVAGLHCRGYSVDQESLVELTAGPITPIKIASEKAAVGEWELLPSHCLKVHLHQEGPGRNVDDSLSSFSGSVVTTSLISAAVKLLFCDGEGDKLHQEIDRAVGDYKATSSKHRDSILPQECGLMFYPTQIAIVAITLLKKNQTNVSLSVEAAVALTAIVEYVCLVLLKACRSHMQCNVCDVNMILPKDVEEAMWTAEAAPAGRSGILGDMSQQERDLIIALRGVIPGRSLSFSSFEQAVLSPSRLHEVASPSSKSQWQSRMCNHVKERGKYGFMSPLTGSFLKIKTERGSSKLHRHPAKDAICAFDSLRRVAAASNVYPEPTWRRDFVDLSQVGAVAFERSIGNQVVHGFGGKFVWQEFVLYATSLLSFCDSSLHWTHQALRLLERFVEVIFVEILHDLQQQLSDRALSIENVALYLSDTSVQLRPIMTASGKQLNISLTEHYISNVAAQNALRKEKEEVLGHNDDDPKLLQSNKATLSSPPQSKRCPTCNAECRIHTTRKKTANYGRRYYSCRVCSGSYFEWADGCPSKTTLKQQPSSSSVRLKAMFRNDNTSKTDYFTSASGQPSSSSSTFQQTAPNGRAFSFGITAQSSSSVSLSPSSAGFVNGTASQTKTSNNVKSANRFVFGSTLSGQSRHENNKASGISFGHSSPQSSSGVGLPVSQCWMQPNIVTSPQVPMKSKPVPFGHSSSSSNFWMGESSTSQSWRQQEQVQTTQRDSTKGEGGGFTFGPSAVSSSSSSLSAFEGFGGGQLSQNQQPTPQHDSAKESDLSFGHSSQQQQQQFSSSPSPFGAFNGPYPLQHQQQLTTRPSSDCGKGGFSFGQSSMALSSGSSDNVGSQFTFGPPPSSSSSSRVLSGQPVSQQQFSSSPSPFGAFNRPYPLQHQQQLTTRPSSDCGKGGFSFGQSSMALSSGASDNVGSQFTFGPPPSSSSSSRVLSGQHVSQSEQQQPQSQSTPLDQRGNVGGGFSFGSASSRSFGGFPVSQKKQQLSQTTTQRTAKGKGFKFGSA